MSDLGGFLLGYFCLASRDVGSWIIEGNFIYLHVNCIRIYN